MGLLEGVLGGGAADCGVGVFWGQSDSRGALLWLVDTETPAARGWGGGAHWGRVFPLPFSGGRGGAFTQPLLPSRAPSRADPPPAPGQVPG